MTKYVFERSYGWLYCRGEYVRETEHQYVVMAGQKPRERRMAKSQKAFIIDCENQDAIERQYRVEYARHQSSVDEARKALKEAEEHQWRSALSAIGVPSNDFRNEEVET